jgi:hypothetical protein
VKMRSSSLTLLAFGLSLSAVGVSQEARASWGLGVGLHQRHSFTYTAEDGDRGGLGAEFSATRSGSVGLAQSRMPSLEAHWYKSQFAATGPLARLRFTPWSKQLRADQDVETGWDGSLQVGHSWSGPEMGALTVAAEFGAVLRAYIATQRIRIPSTSMAGAFSSLIVNRQPWSLQLELSLLAFSLSGHESWGFHRDSNSLRIRGMRHFNEEKDWTIWGEFFHLHRTFTNSEFGFSRSVFLSDVTFGLGVSRSL